MERIIENEPNQKTKCMSCSYGIYFSTETMVPGRPSQDVSHISTYDITASLEQYCIKALMCGAWWLSRVAECGTSHKTNKNGLL